MIDGDEFFPALREFLAAKRFVGKSGKVFGPEMLGTSSTWNNLRTLSRLVLDKKPSRTLEIGFAFGASTLVLAEAHRSLGHTGQRHVAIDPFQIDGFDCVGLQNIAAAGLTQYLDFRPFLSAIELPKLLDKGDKFGLIYVDGSHEFEEVFLDAYYSTRLLAPDGIILFDDSPHPPIAKVIGMLRKSRLLSEVDLLPWRNDSLLRYRAGRFLGRLQLTAFQRRSS